MEYGESGIVQELRYTSPINRGLSDNNVIALQEIKEGADMDLNFVSALEYAFFHDMTNYAIDEVGMLSLRLSSIDNMSFFKFIVKILKIDSSDTDMEVHIPKETDKSDFDYNNINRKFLTMPYKQTLKPEVNKKLVMFILVKFKQEPMSETAKLKQSKVNMTIDLSGKDSDRIRIPIEVYIPYLIKVQTDTKKSAIIYSEFNVNIYEDNIVKNKSKKVARLFSISKEEATKIYFLELYGTESDGIVHLWYQSYAASSIISTDITKNSGFEFPLRCSYDETMYITVSFADLEQRALKWVYLREDWGLLNIEYFSFTTIDENNANILPPTMSKINGPQQIKNPYHIIKMECIYPGSASFVFAEKKDQDFVIKDQGYVTNYILNRGIINIDTSKDRNFETSFGSSKTATYVDEDIKIIIGSTEYILNKTKKVLRIPNMEEGRLTIDNPFEDLALEFKFGTLNKMVQVTEKEVNITDKFIYCKLESERASGYKFTFDNIGVREFQIDMDIAAEGFMVMPFNKVMSNSAGELIYTENPYNKLGPLLPEEFYYYGIRIADGISTYSFKVEPIIDEPVDVLKLTSLNYLKQKISSLHLNKYSINSHLVVFISQCDPTDFELKLFYGHKFLPSIYGKNRREVILFENQFIPYDIEFSHVSQNEGAKLEYYLSYNYLTNEDAIKIKGIINKTYKVNFDKDTLKLTWSSPDASITKFRLYLFEKDSDLNTECEILQTNMGIDVEKTEFSFGDSNILSGEYKVNILAMNEDKIQYAVLYEEVVIQFISSKILQLTDMETPMKLDFNQSFKYPLYFDLKDYLVNEEGVITLLFDREIPKLGDKKTKFFSKIVKVDFTQDISKSFPKSISASHFKYEVEGNNQLRMYFSNPEVPEKNKKILFLINIIFDKAQNFTANISTSKVPTEITTFGKPDPDRITFNLQENIPHYVKIGKEGIFDKTILFFSDAAVNVYEGSLLKKKDFLNKKETLKMKSISSDDYDKTYILEFFGDAKEVTFQFEKVDDSFNVITAKIGKYTRVKCDLENVDTSQYYGFSFANDVNLTEHYISLTHKYGLYNYYLQNTIELKENISSIISTSDDLFNGFSVLTSPNFIIRMECKFPGETLLVVSKSTKEIQLNDNMSLVSFVLTEGNHEVNFLSLKAYNIEITLSHVKSKKRNDGITINVDDKAYLLTESQQILKLKDINDQKITIDNPYENAVIDFEVPPVFDIPQVNGNESVLDEEYIYYIFNSERASHYVFKFNVTITSDFEYELTKGDKDFIQKPGIDFKSEGKQEFTVQNPYNSHGHLLPEEFYYISLYIPYKSLPYTLTIDPIEDKAPYTVVPSKILSQFETTSHSLRSTKDKYKTILVVFMTQCIQQNYQINLIYNKKIIDSKQGNNIRHMLTFTHDYLPLNIESSFDDVTKIKYLLSYNYFTSEEAQTMKNMVEKKHIITFKHNKLTWESPDPSIKEYEVFLLPKDNAINISNECALYNQEPTAKVQSPEYTVDLFSSGLYKVNILARGNDNFEYVIAYDTLEFEIKSNTSNNNIPLIWIGIVCVVFALLVIVFVIFFFRKQKRLEEAEFKFSQIATTTQQSTGNDELKVI